MDDVAILRKITITVDALGNDIEAVVEKTVYCQTRSVTRSEFYNAAQAGLRPSVDLILQNKADYDGEQEAEWRGKIYKVIRTYWTDADEIELILEERTAQNG